MLEVEEMTAVVGGQVDLYITKKMNTSHVVHVSLQSIFFIALLM